MQKLDWEKSVPFQADIEKIVYIVIVLSCATI